MPDSPKNSETTSGPTPDATLDAPAPRPQPSMADTARQLAEHFPALFGAGLVKPIKLRIQADIHQRAPGVFTKKALSVFLQRHTTGTAYLRALVAEGATRFDLDGQPVGEIAAEHRDAASVELERRRAIVEARRHAEREAARASRPDAGPIRGSRPVHPGVSDGPDRSPIPSRPGQVPRPSQPGSPQNGRRPSDTGAGAPRRPRKPRPERNRVRADEREPANTPTLPLTPEEAAEAKARNQRALLLRSFEQSPLSKANFGALNGLSEGALDALLTLARQERGSR